jgi:GNAT superfamily N-acetyltransferase
MSLSFHGRPVPPDTAAAVATIYTDSFPNHERVPIETVFDDVARGERMLWLSDQDSGFAVTRALSTSEGDVLLEYLAVDAAKRSAGIGAKLLHDIHAGVGHPLVFEVEDPVAAPSPDRSRRIAFYERNGAAAIACEGYRAPYTTGEGTYPMLLFTLPADYGSDMTGPRFRELVRRIWLDGYGRDPADPLLADVLAGLSC